MYFSLILIRKSNPLLSTFFYFSVLILVLGWLIPFQSKLELLPSPFPWAIWTCPSALTSGTSFPSESSQWYRTFSPDTILVTTQWRLSYTSWVDFGHRGWLWWSLVGWTWSFWAHHWFDWCPWQLSSSSSFAIESLDWDHNLWCHSYLVASISRSQVHYYPYSRF